MQRDTAAATPPQALIVRVRGPDGEPARGRVVRFESLRLADGFLTMFVSRINSDTFRVLDVVTTNESGQAAVLVRYGIKAGPAGVVVHVPEFGYKDTISYEVLPGRTAGMRAVGPTDTAVIATRTFTLRGEGVDQWGNPTTDPVTYRALSPAISVSTSGVVTGAQVGRAEIEMRVGPSRSGVLVSVVPSFAMVAEFFDGRVGPRTIRVMNSDGSALRNLTRSGTRPVFVPGRDEILMLNASRSRPIYRVDFSGAAEPLEIGPPPASFYYSYSFAASGNPLYLSAGNCNSVQTVFRVNLTAMRSDSVSPPAGDECTGPSEMDPSSSPDGSRVALRRDQSLTAPTIVVRDGTTRVGRDIAIGVSPSWSPKGDLIAFVYAGAVFVVRPDGSGERQVSKYANAEAMTAWTPDGDWIIACMRPIGPFAAPCKGALIGVNSGEEIPLPFLSSPEYVNTRAQLIR